MQKDLWTELHEKQDYLESLQARIVEIEKYLEVSAIAMMDLEEEIGKINRRILFQIKHHQPAKIWVDKKKIQKPSHLS